MAHLFLIEVLNRPLEEWQPLLAHEDFPGDWGAMYKYCEEFENNQMATTSKGHMIAEALFDQFADRFFPSPLRPLGRAIPISLSLPQTLKAHRIQPTNPILARFIILLVGSFMWFMETLFPDPKISYQETLRLKLADNSRRQQTRKLDYGFPATFAKNHQGAAAFCPFLSRSRYNRSKKQEAIVMIFNVSQRLWRQRRILERIRGINQIRLQFSLSSSI